VAEWIHKISISFVLGLVTDRPTLSMPAPASISVCFTLTGDYPQRSAS
jgi:hypothetical protein